MQDKLQIDAVLDEQLDELLARLGIQEDFYAAKYKCKICNEIITKENLKLIFPDRSRISFLCDKPACMLKYALGE